MLWLSRFSATLGFSGAGFIWFGPVGKLECGGGEDLPCRRSGTSVVHGTLRLDVEVHHDAAPQLRHFAGPEAERDYAVVVAVVDIPDPGRSKIIPSIEIVVSEMAVPLQPAWVGGPIRTRE
jgi:hypothetical protein